MKNPSMIHGHSVIASASSQPDQSSVAEESKRSRAIFVLGMHRSGTSALTRVLNLLGVDLGDRLLPPDTCNRSGYWEDIDLVQLNNRVLLELQAKWDSLWKLPDGWHERPCLDSHRRDLVTWVSREIANKRFWGAKDPRMSRVLPLWAPLLQSHNVGLGCVHIFRHPAAVVASLRKRDLFTVDKAYFLWLRYVLDAEKNSRQLPRAIVAYEQFTSDWQQACHRISLALDLTWPNAVSTTSPMIDEFLSHGQNRTPPEDRFLVGHPTLEELVSLTYSALCQHQFQDDFLIRELFDVLRERLNQLTDRFQPHFGRSTHQLPRIASTQLKQFREDVTSKLRSLPDVQQHLLHHPLAPDLRAGKVTFNSIHWMISRRLSRLRSWAAPDETRLGELNRILILAGRTLRNEGLQPFLVFVGSRILSRLCPTSLSNDLTSNNSRP